MLRTGMIAFVFGAVLTLALGCNSQPAAENATAVTNREVPATELRAPKPDATRLEFDEKTQVLKLYELPEHGAYWMVSLPNEPRGVPVQGDYFVGGKTDKKAVSVFYTMPKGGLSSAVSLQEIVDAKKPVH